MTTKRVLCIAFHVPPVRVSSGIQRTLKFATYLREHDWESVILTAHPRAYEFTSPDQLDEIPKDMVVSRAFAFDTGRHLALFGRYPNWLAIPDRYWTWLLGGLFKGIALIRRLRAAVIWSAYPFATAHLIGGLLHRITGLPWIAVFRDSMTEETYPPDPLRWRACRRIERYAVEHAFRCVSTTEGTRSMYAARYPTVPLERWAVIPNGFDEDNFVQAEAAAAVAPIIGARPMTLVHSGVLYLSERDPTQFFDAVHRLKISGTIDARRLRIVLRATGANELYQRRLLELGIDDVVEVRPGVTYQEALVEMLTADGLLLFQASNSNHQVPAKLYEYLRAGRPILALTDPVGDTARALRDAGVGATTALDDVDAIADALPRFTDDVRTGRQRGASREGSRRFSRRSGAAALAGLLDAANQPT